MVTIRHELASDASAREALLSRAFGKSRRRKTSERLREGRLPCDGLAFSAVGGKGRLIGTLRLWDVIAGSAGPALLLGPLAVDCKQQGKGRGAALMECALNEARTRGGDPSRRCAVLWPLRLRGGEGDGPAPVGTGRPVPFPRAGTGSRGA